MIFRLLILGLLWFLQSIVNVLPVGGLPPEVYNAVATALTYLAGWQSVFPVDTLLDVLRAVITFQLVVWGWKIGVWVYGRIRGVSSK